MYIRSWATKSFSTLLFSLTESLPSSFSLSLHLAAINKLCLRHKGSCRRWLPCSVWVFLQKNISIVVDTLTTSSASLYCVRILGRRCYVHVRVDTPHVSMERNRLAIMKEHTLPADRSQFSVNRCRGNSIWLNNTSHVDRNGKAKLSAEKCYIFSHFICPFAHNCDSIRKLLR